jgi:predicted DNA-binding WGR domain protein
MRKPLLALEAAVLLLCLAAALYALPSEIDDQLTARRRLFSPIGPGLREVRRSSHGDYYVLASSTGVSIFDSQFKQLSVIGAPPETSGANPSGSAPATFGEDCDVDAQGNLYVADRASNLINVFSPDGKLLRSFRVQAPVSLAALPDGEVAVTTLERTHLVTVYGADGKIARAFGDPESVSSRADVDQLANFGRVVSDPQGHIYFGFTYLPEPLVREYDRFGYAGQSFEFTGVDAFPEAQATRKEIERLESAARKESAKPPVLRPILTAFGVDPAGGDLWMGLHNTIVHFDKDGVRRSEYQVYTTKGARLEAAVLLVQEDTLLIGSDPLGVYEFERPDKRH